MHRRTGWLHATVCAVVAIAALSLATSADAKHKKATTSPVDTVSVTNVISLPNGGKITSFDIGFVDPDNNLYALADRTNAAVVLVDTISDQVVAQLFNANANFAGPSTSNDTAGPDGVVIAEGIIWVGDGNSTLKLFDEFSGGALVVLNTGGKLRADEGCYDDKDKLMMFANDADAPPFLTVWDASVYPPVLKKTIPMSGSNGSPNATNGIEQCQYVASTGNFLVNIPAVNGPPGSDSVPGAVVEVSPKTLAITNIFTIPLANCAGPQGMAVGKTDVMLGCNASFNTVVIDPATGNVVKAIFDQGGADEIYYNSGDNAFFFAISSPLYSGLQHLGIVNDNPAFTNGVSYETGIKTGIGGVAHGSNHSVAADSGTNQIYVPIASTAGSDICSSHGGNDANGCIAVFKAP